METKAIKTLCRGFVKQGNKCVTEICTLRSEHEAEVQKDIRFALTRVHQTSSFFIHKQLFSAISHPNMSDVLFYYAYKPQKYLKSD